MRTGVLLRRLSAAAAVVISVAATLTVLAAPAQAYTCSGGRSITVNNTSGVSRVTLTFYPRCSDNKAHWNGVVHDTSCDGRSGKVVIVGNPSILPDGTVYGVWDHAYHANNGCGTSASFSGSNYGLGAPWSVRVSAGACNSWSCATYSHGYIYS